MTQNPKLSSSKHQKEEGQTVEERKEANNASHRKSRANTKATPTSSTPRVDSTDDMMYTSTADISINSDVSMSSVSEPVNETVTDIVQFRTPKRGRPRGRRQTNASHRKSRAEAKTSPKQNAKEMTTPEERNDDLESTTSIDVSMDP